MVYAQQVRLQRFGAEHTRDLGGGEEGREFMLRLDICGYSLCRRWRRRRWSGDGFERMCEFVGFVADE